MAESFERARVMILDSLSPLGSESVGLIDLAGRVAAEDVCAPWAMPRWDNSEMDGFAVRAKDCHPGCCLRVSGNLPAGVSAQGISVAAGTAVRIMTGAPVPDGGDAIVPIENATVAQELVTINCPVAVGDFIRACGSDIAAGEPMIPVGKILRPAEVNLLAAFNRQQLLVFRRPRVAILSTGDELVAPGEIAGPGKIIDTNAYSLAAAVRELGAIPLLLGIAKDDPDSLREKISQGLQADALITSAGASAGDRDFVCETLERVGVERLFWRVAMKPAGPTAFGLKAGIPVFSLPGNPVSSMIGFEELVRPALLKMSGHSTLFRSLHRARAKATLHNHSGKVRFLRVKVTETPEGLVVESSGNQNTGILSTMIRADALAILPAEKTEIVSGEEVDIHFI